MTIDIISSESEFVTALIAASDFHRALVEEGQVALYPSDNLLNSRAKLASLVNTLFWASLAVEEGRPMTGSICICSPEQAPRSRALERAAPLTLKNLIALLTASSDAPLAVHLENDTLEIWGFVDSQPMFALSLRIASVGTIVALHDQATVALLHEGSVHITAQAHIIDLTSRLAKTLELESSFPERMKLAHYLTKAIMAMHSHRHGGAILITPTTNDSWRDSVDMRFTFNVSSFNTLPDILMELENARSAGDDQALDAYIALLYKGLKRVGQLTAIDGALVVREDLAVLGFGAKLKSPLDERLTVSRFNAITQEVLRDRPISDLGGTRHQSAACFVNQHHDCNVVVSSQDGRLTLLTWVSDIGTVGAISALEHFVWGELP